MVDVYVVSLWSEIIWYNFFFCDFVGVHIVFQNVTYPREFLM